MDESHDREHDNAGCPYQYTFFNEIILKEDQRASIDILKTYKENLKLFPYQNYDVFIWTGGLGNIYLPNIHNRNQLYVCERVLSLNKPLWGSCWGLQVIATCYGDKIVKAKKPEFGFSDNIKIIKNHHIYDDKEDLFTAPGHHYDNLENINSDFEIITQNEISIQSISHKSMNIFCTQYHPELPYIFISKLMTHWKKNYLEIMSNDEFNKIIKKLYLLEENDMYVRKKEFRAWLNTN